MEDVREVVVRWKKNKLCMREACLPRKRRERERESDLFVACAVGKCLPARMSRRKCHYVSRDGFNCFDHIQWEWKEKVHVENVERSTGIIEEGGGRREGDFARIGINCTASASIVYRIATEPLLNRSVIRDRSLPTFSIMSPRGKNARIKFHLACGGCTEGWITNIYISARSSVERIMAQPASYLSSIRVGIGWNWVATYS